MNVEGVVATAFDFPRTPGDQASPESRTLILRELVTTFALVPAVGGVALDIYGPHGSRALGTIAPPEPGAPDPVRATYWPVTPGWFELFQHDVLHGRTLDAEEWIDGESDVVIPTESLALRLSGQSDVVGRTVMARFSAPRERRIVGIVPDYRSMAAPEAPTDAPFVPYGKHPGFGGYGIMLR